LVWSSGRLSHHCWGWFSVSVKMALWSNKLVCQ
jgi:hypothetical protein